MNHANETPCKVQVFLSIALLSVTGGMRAQDLPTGKQPSSFRGETTQELNRRLEESRKTLSLALPEPTEDESRIGPDDLLQITVFEAPDLNRTLRVSANGEISLQLLGPVKAGGLTPRQLASRWGFCSRVAEPSRLGRGRGEETWGLPNSGHEDRARTSFDG